MNRGYILAVLPFSLVLQRLPLAKTLGVCMSVLYSLNPSFDWKPWFMLANAFIFSDLARRFALCSAVWGVVVSELCLAPLLSSSSFSVRERQQPLTKKFKPEICSPVRVLYNIQFSVRISPFSNRFRADYQETSN